MKNHVKKFTPKYCGDSFKVQYFFDEFEDFNFLFDPPDIANFNQVFSKHSKFQQHRIMQVDFFLFCILVMNRKKFEQLLELMLHNSQMTFPNTKVVTRTGFEPAALSGSPSTT
jgi:hypothetical protein